MESSLVFLGLFLHVKGTSSFTNVELSASQCNEKYIQCCTSGSWTVSGISRILQLNQRLCTVNCFTLTPRHLYVKGKRGSWVFALINFSAIVHLESQWFYFINRLHGSDTFLLEYSKGVRLLHTKVIYNSTYRYVNEMGIEYCRGKLNFPNQKNTYGWSFVKKYFIFDEWDRKEGIRQAD